MAGFSIPAFPLLNPDRPTRGQHCRHGCGTSTGATNTGGHNPRTPFANYIGHHGAQGGLPAIGGGGGGGCSSRGPLGGGPLFVPFIPKNKHNAGPMYSNIIKRYSSWNVCFPCRFNMEDGHTSKTCSLAWQCVNHQEGFNHTNANLYISAGYDACTKAMHKSQFSAS
jgi:hypothetical protein